MQSAGVPPENENGASGIAEARIAEAEQSRADVEEVRRDLLLAGVDVDVEPFPRMADKAHHRAPPGHQRERAVRSDGDIRQLSGPVAADSAAVETVGGELEIFRNERQQHRTAHTRAARG